MSSTTISSALLRQRLAEAEKLRDELKARRALSDPWFWLTECTKTQDEQDPENPYKPFPKKDYLFHTLQAMQQEPVLFIEKSRTMMISWTAAGFAAHMGFSRPAVGVIFQSQDEARAVHDVDYVKVLWEQSDPVLKAKWPLKKPMEKQAYDSLELANGSWFLGIPGNPGKIRSEHPTVVVLDEAAHIEKGEESYNVAVATRCLHMIALTSANPGWFRDATEFAVPVDWPEYYSKRAA